MVTCMAVLDRRRHAWLVLVAALATLTAGIVLANAALIAAGLALAALGAFALDR